MRLRHACTDIKSVEGQSERDAAQNSFGADVYGTCACHVSSQCLIRLLGCIVKSTASLGGNADVPSTFSVGDGDGYRCIAPCCIQDPAAFVEERIASRMQVKAGSLYFSPCRIK